MNVKREQWTETAVFERLSKVFPSPAFVLLPQVRNGTGYARTRTRTADAVAVSVYPSRGLYLAGIEIKVSKSDWRRELADPQKSVSIQKHCRYWYIAAPAGVVPQAELPETWGLIEVDAKGATIVVKGKELDAVAPDMLLLASILRKTAEVTVPADHVQSKIKEHGERIAESKKRLLEQKIDRLKDSIARFEEASGVKIDEYNEHNIGAAVRIVLDGRQQLIEKQLLTLKFAASNCLKMADEALQRIKETPT